MAKKMQEQEYENYALKERNANKKQKRNSKKTKNKPDNNKFSFENEIVIGVTKVPESKKGSRKQVTTKNKKNDTKKDQNKNVKPKKEIKTNKNKKVKRKVVLSQEEQEIKDKKRHKRNKTIKYIILIILFITLVVVTMFSPLFNIKTIIVQRNEKVSQNEIISLSQIQLEENTFKLNKNKIKEQIKQNAYINDVQINRKLPSTIELVIEERKAAYLLEYAESYVYIDKKGFILEISTEKLELPILQGAETTTEEFIVGRRLSKNDLEKLSTVFKIVELAEANNLLSIISKIDIENEENYKLIFESKEKVAYLGDSSNLNTKILTIIAILEKEEGKAGEIFVNMDLNKENPMFRERV